MLYYKVYYLALFVVHVDASFSIKHKRQLFRENLIPQFGGKIPEGAFNKDRLLLNRFNQHGLYLSDGQYIEQRPLIYNNKHFLYDTIQVKLPPSNNRFVAPQGWSHNGRNVDTSYLLREPVQYSLLPNLVFHKFPSAPILSLNLVRSRNKKQAQFPNNFWSGISAEQILRELKPRLHSVLHYDD